MRGWGRLLAWAGLMLVAGLVPILVGWSDLPDPVATHWGPGGAPNGSIPKAWIWALPVFVVGLGLSMTSFLRRDGRPSAESVAILGLLGGIGIWISASLVVLNGGAESWEQADSFGWWQVVGVVVAGALFAWVGYVIGKRWYPPVPPVSLENAPAFDMGVDELAVWIGSARVWWPFLLLVPLGAVFLFLPDWMPWLSLLFVALGFLFSKVTAVVDRRGLRVGLLGRLTVKRIPLERVSSSRPIDLEPGQWGGWGYRVVPGGSAVVLRRGDAIEVTMTDDRRFAVTVDDAATGSALLNGLVHRLAQT